MTSHIILPQELFSQLDVIEQLSMMLKLVPTGNDVEYIADHQWGISAYIAKNWIFHPIILS